MCIKLTTISALAVQRSIKYVQSVHVVLIKWLEGFKIPPFFPCPSQFVESLFCTFNMILFSEDISYAYYWFLVEIFQKKRLRKSLLRRLSRMLENGIGGHFYVL
ncbi:hypothetical protein P3S68_018552 [Capsicum galapagoense]